MLGYLIGYITIIGSAYLLALADILLWFHIWGIILFLGFAGFCLMIWDVADEKITDKQAGIGAFLFLTSMSIVYFVLPVAG